MISHWFKGCTENRWRMLASTTITPILTIVDVLLLYDDRIVIPRNMRLQILDYIHTGHLDLTKCRSGARPRLALYWHKLEIGTPRLTVKLKKRFAEQSMLKKNEDTFSALLTYRSTLLQNGYSPSELVIGGRLQMQLPTHPANLYPNVQIKDHQLVEGKESSYRLNQQHNFDKRHRAKELPTHASGDRVRIRDEDRYGLVAEKTEKPCSYLVITDKSTLRRNRSVLVATAKSTDTEQSKAVPTPDITPYASVPCTPPRPQTAQITPSPQTAVPTATLGPTPEECVLPLIQALKSWQPGQEGLWGLL